MNKGDIHSLIEEVEDLLERKKENSDTHINQKSINEQKDKEKKEKDKETVIEKNSDETNKFIDYNDAFSLEDSWNYILFENYKKNDNNQNEVLSLISEESNDNKNNNSKEIENYDDDSSLSLSSSDKLSVPDDYNEDLSIQFISAKTCIMKLLSPIVTVPFFCYTLLLPILDGVRVAFEKESMKAKKEEERENIEVCWCVIVCGKNL
jgi:hypothetical protein